MNIAENRERYLELILKAYEARGVDPSNALQYLDNSDFFTAPASTKYHNSVFGGLCDHCLNVYDNLVKIVEMKNFSDKITEDSIIIVSLYHDLAKVNFYETYSKNVKVYCEDGDKKDGMGKYKWESITAYKVKEEEDRFIFGNHEETSEYLASTLIPLTKEESMSIIKHHAGMSKDSTPEGISEVYNACPLACFLHMADTIATFCDERLTYEQSDC